MNGSALAFLVRAFYSEKKHKIFQLTLPAERKKAKKKCQNREMVSNARELMHAT